MPEHETDRLQTPEQSSAPRVAPSGCLILEREEHPVSRSMIDPDALRIMYRLKHAGHQAYLVGGAVRDFLRGVQPKDFDIATDATPMQLRRLFRNSRIIGRRFKLVHVFFGPKNIEVATLRRSVNEAEEGNYQEEDDLYIRDDNLWGDVESDSRRRDFTINGLFYQLDGFRVLDYTGGVADIRQEVIRSIGDPRLRFQEDPVRMLRAIKFAARFRYTIAPEDHAAIPELAASIHDASRFRVTEEIFRILQQVNRHRGLEMLRDYGFLAHLFPSWITAIGDEGLEQVIDFFDAVECESREERFLPLEVLAAGLFLPMLDTVSLAESDYSRHSAELTREVRQIASEMDLPKKLTGAVVALLRGQLYLLYFAHRDKNLRRFVRSPEFDWVWRLHDLAFGHLEELHPLQEKWLAARESTNKPLGGWADSPDDRDIFSFRGRRGGGRVEEDEPQTILETSNKQKQASDKRRRRGGRGRRRRG